MYASDRATINYYLKHHSGLEQHTETMKIEEIMARAQAGDTDATDALRKSAEYIGLGIANIIRTIDPQNIIIGGSIIKVWKTIYPVIMETVYKRGFFGKQRNTLILPTSLTDDPPLLGAAALSIRKIFTDYRIVI